MAITMRASLPTAAPRLTSCETSAALRITGRAVAPADADIDATAGSGAKEIDMGGGAMTKAAERAILPAYARHPKFIFVICRMTTAPRTDVSDVSDTSDISIRG